VVTLLHVLHHFLNTHPQACPPEHPWSKLYSEASRGRSAEACMFKERNPTTRARGIWCRAAACRYRAGQIFLCWPPYAFRARLAAAL
jgi:hypothetical protein